MLSLALVNIMRVFHLIKKGIQSPERVPPFLFSKIEKSYNFSRTRCLLIMHLIKSGQYDVFKGLVFNTAVGHNTHIQKHRDNGELPLVKQSVDGHDMFLNLADEGISKELLINRTREKDEREVFKSELSKLKNEVDGPINILEIGANIGYYVLHELEVLGERARIFAIEPGPDNIVLLKRNVALWGAQNNVDIQHGALGSETGTKTLEITSLSNCHRILTDEHKLSAFEHKLAGEKATVNVWTPTDYMQNKQIERVNVIRMDVEGYEGEIISEIDRVIEGDHPLLFYVEIHPVHLSNNTIDLIINKFKRHDLEFVWAGGKSDKKIQCLEDIKKSVRAVPVVLKR